MEGILNLDQDLIGENCEDVPVCVTVNQATKGTGFQGRNYKIVSIEIRSFYRYEEIVLPDISRISADTFKGGFQAARGAERPCTLELFLRPNIVRLRLSSNVSSRVYNLFLVFLLQLFAEYFPVIKRIANAVYFLISFMSFPCHQQNVSIFDPLKRPGNGFTTVGNYPIVPFF